MQADLFLESIYDALSAIVRHSGGMKAVGSRLWPAKSPEAAGKALADCLNPLRADTLDPEEVVHLLRIGREADFHDAKHWLDAETGYTPSEPVDADDQAIALTQRLDGLLREVRGATAALERIRKGAKR